MLSHLKKRTPHRFHFEIIPKRCDGLHGLPASGAVSVVCESGSKISYTETTILQDDGTAEFRSVIRMASTIYKQDHCLLPKEYTFKVQLIRDASSRMFTEQQRRRTIARGKLNMAEFCSHTSTPAAAEVLVPLHPQGRLTLAIRAVWVQQYQQPAGGATHASGETDSVTEISSIRSSVDNDTASMDSSSTGRGQAMPPPSAASPTPDSLDTRAASGAATVNRTSSADLSSLTDYHLRVNSITVKQQAELERVVEEALAEQQAEQQQVLLAGRQPQPMHQGHAMPVAPPTRIAHPASSGRGSSAGLLHAASPQKPPLQQQQQQAQAGMSNSIASKTGRVGKLQRNSAHSDTAAALRCIDPIIETDREGHDCVPCGATSLDRALSEEALRAHLQAVGSDNPFLAADSMVSSSPEPSTRLQQLQHQQHWAAGPRDEGLPGAADEPPAGVRGFSGHLRGWVWPFSRDFVKGVTTDELMRQIETSAKDVPKLQQLCRGLLVERNDWRYKATQWERNSQALQEQVDALNNTKVVLVNQLMAAEGQLAQLQKNALLDKLVEAKLQLAQSDLHASELQGQLAREQERSKQLATRLTVLQSKHERLMSQQATAQQLQLQQQQQHKQPALMISPFQAASQVGGDQGQGEGLMSPAVDASPSVPAMRRSAGDVAAGSSSAAGGGWGWSQWMRGGSFVGRSGGSSSSQPVH